MGIYLGQLPPAEVARLKAELAETLIANFCYPRFFDNRVGSLCTRPVDRAKRQEVWLFLSAVDFTSWSRVDLTSPDFQHQIERLFILFVQRNRAFFGNQGRKRMSDIRMLINSSASSVVLGLRNHLTGQRQQGNVPFGSPRPAVSWSQLNTAGRSEPTWEQIASTTMMLQQQLQELRGEAKPVVANEPPHSTNGTARRTARLQDAASTLEQDAATPTRVPPGTTPSPASRNSGHAAPPAPPTTPAKRPDVAPAPAASAADVAQVSAPLPSARSPMPERVSGPLPPATRTSGPLPPSEPARLPVTAAPPAPSAPVPSRSAPQQMPSSSSPLTSSAVAPSQRESSMMTVGEDDIAIFEQMRHQLLIWLRVEAIRAGLEIPTSLTPTQLLDMLRQQARLDETRLQVVSTLLNLSNQVTKTGLVTILDYKQALMFHLMHTRR